MCRVCAYNHVCIWISGCSGSICWSNYFCFIVLPLFLCQRAGDIFMGDYFWTLFYSLICLLFCQYYTVLYLYSKCWSGIASVLQLCSHSFEWVWQLYIAVIYLWNHHSGQNIEPKSLQKVPCIPLVTVLCNLFWTKLVFFLFGFHINRLIQHALSCAWLIKISMRFIHLVRFIDASFLLPSCISLHI